LEIHRTSITCDDKIHQNHQGKKEERKLKMSSPTPKGPYTLVTVNNSPERAQRLVGRVVEIVKDRYVIKHVANAESEWLEFHQLMNRNKN
jgi:hypothetical protein